METIKNFFIRFITKCRAGYKYAVSATAEMTYPVARRAFGDNEFAKPLTLKDWANFALGMALFVVFFFACCTVANVVASLLAMALATFLPAIVAAVLAGVAVIWFINELSGTFCTPMIASAV